MDIKGKFGVTKQRALAISSGTFEWEAEHISRTARILGVLYNLAGSKLVQNESITKRTILLIDDGPLKEYYLSTYTSENRVYVYDRSLCAASNTPEGPMHEMRLNNSPLWNETHLLTVYLKKQYDVSDLLACVKSRPGQSGKVEGYLLEDEELEFYIDKIWEDGNDAPLIPDNFLQWVPLSPRRITLTSSDDVVIGERIASTLGIV